MARNRKGTHRRRRETRELKESPSWQVDLASHSVTAGGDSGSESSEECAECGRAVHADWCRASD